MHMCADEGEQGDGASLRLDLEQKPSGDLEDKHKTAENLSGIAR